MVSASFFKYRAIFFFWSWGHFLSRSLSTFMIKMDFLRRRKNFYDQVNFSIFSTGPTFLLFRWLTSFFWCQRLFKRSRPHLLIFRTFHLFTKDQLLTSNKKLTITTAHLHSHFHPPLKLSNKLKINIYSLNKRLQSLSGCESEEWEWGVFLCLY